MYIYSKQIVTLLLVAAAAGCVSTITRTTQDIECKVGKECTIIGELFVYRGSPASIAELKTEDGCFAISLAPEEYSRYHKIMGVRVRVTGTSYTQDLANSVVSYRFRDRDVATGICPSGLVIYAVRVEQLQ